MVIPIVYILIFIYAMYIFINQQNKKNVENNEILKTSTLLINHTHFI